MEAGAALARRVGDALLARGLRLGVGESCTGGLVGGLLTGVPGSSRWFLGGVTAYHNRVKVAVLGVPPRLLRRAGAVSPGVAAAMARGARRALGADRGLSVTGVAGPGGGSPGKPVGLVYAAVSAPGRTRWRAARYDGDRAAVRARALELALNLLLEDLEAGA